MSKAKIICRQNDSGMGVKFECGNCGKSVFVNTLCKRKECIRCGKKFKQLIKIEKVEE